MRIIAVPSAMTGMRLDQCIPMLDSTITRSEAAKLIKQGELLVNDKKERSSYRIKLDDRISINARREYVDPLRPITKKLDIIFEDDDVFVINKQTQLTVHPPNENDPQETLVNYLLAYYPALADVGDDRLRPGIVHRLDKLASGVIVVAKNKKSFEHLKRAWQGGVIQKTYTVLVWGVLDHGDTIEASIARSKRTGKMVTTSDGGKVARTHYSILKNFTNATLLLVTTDTGRTHQIRTHFKSIGHPVVGDPLYIYKKIPRSIRIPRLFLHASSLVLPMLSGEERTFEAPLPRVYNNFLKILKRTS